MSAPFFFLGGGSCLVDRGDRESCTAPCANSQSLRPILFNNPVIFDSSAFQELLLFFLFYLWDWSLPIALVLPISDYMCT